MAHHAARLGAALAFCDRCPCSVSLHPPQAALDSAAPEGEALSGLQREKAPLPGELDAQRPEGSYFPAAPHFPGHSNVFFIIPVSFFSYKKRTKRILTKKGMGVHPCLLSGISLVLSLQRKDNKL
ncbi:MAG: hypothetical protein ACLTWO_12185 [Blautia massiliensis (ex Durand et al. 2017)]